MHKSSHTCQDDDDTFLPQYGFGWKALGAVLKQMGQDADALISTRKATALAPDDAEVHSNLGLIFYDLGWFGEAEISLRQALQTG